MQNKTTRNNTMSQLIATALTIVMASSFVVMASSSGSSLSSDSDDKESGSSKRGGGSTNGDRLRLRCDADGSDDFSMDGRFESRGSRLKFDASFEAEAGLGFEAGQVLTVSVGGKAVGEMVLFVGAGGDVEGDLNFDTSAQSDDDDLPFPTDFPEVFDGASVVVGSLGCDLDND
jgi:hypothetical protein